MKSIKSIASVASVLCVSMLFVACAQKDYHAKTKTNSKAKTAAQLPVKKIFEAYGLNGDVKDVALSEAERNSSIEKITNAALLSQREIIAKAGFKAFTGDDKTQFNCSGKASVVQSELDVTKSNLNLNSANMVDAELAKKDVLSRVDKPISGLSIAISEQVTCLSADGKLSVGFKNMISDVEYLRLAASSVDKKLSAIKNEKEKIDSLEVADLNLVAEVVVLNKAEVYPASEYVTLNIAKEDEKMLPEEVLRMGEIFEGGHMISIPTGSLVPSLEKPVEVSLLSAQVRDSKELEAEIASLQPEVAPEPTAPSVTELPEQLTATEGEVAAPAESERPSSDVPTTSDQATQTSEPVVAADETPVVPEAVNVASEEGVESQKLEKVETPVVEASGDGNESDVQEGSDQGVYNPGDSSDDVLNQNNVSDNDGDQPDLKENSGNDNEGVVKEKTWAKRITEWYNETFKKN